MKAGNAQWGYSILDLKSTLFSWGGHGEVYCSIDSSYYVGLFDMLASSHG